MACFSPLQGSYVYNSDGTKSLVFSSVKDRTYMPMTVPCGQCTGCRIERSRQWAMRCSHEASLYEHNCFITLTYSDEFLPSDLSLDVSHFQKFMKRLRKRFGSGVRYLHCGEYGEENLRPHYHACLFNFDFPDKEFLKMSNGYRLYTSQILSDIWGFGMVSIGTLTFQSAGYIARYSMKKVTGKDSRDHYNGRKPEYITMSRRPGIGKLWYEKYVNDVYNCDYIVVNGKKMRPPKYYDFLFKKENPSAFAKIKTSRLLNSLSFESNSTPERLVVRETIQNLRLKSLKRPL